MRAGGVGSQYLDPRNAPADERKAPYPRQLAATLDSEAGVGSVIIHLNGWPGSGKLTVARVVARKLEARLLDNHTLHDVAGRLCDRHTREYWELYYQVRDIAYKRVRALPSHEVIVMTNALALESDREREAWAAVKALALDRGVPLVAVTLQCSLDENVRLNGPVFLES